MKKDDIINIIVEYNNSIFATSQWSVNDLAQALYERIEKSLQWHFCSNGDKYRKYPPLLCSMCMGRDLVEDRLKRINSEGLEGTLGKLDKLGYGNYVFLVDDTRVNFFYGRYYGERKNFITEKTKLKAVRKALDQIEGERKEDE